MVISSDSGGIMPGSLPCHRSEYSCLARTRQLSRIYPVKSFVQLYIL